METTLPSLPFPFLLRFLESSEPVDTEQTGGVKTDTQTGDGTKPPVTDSVEDEDETDE